MGFLAIYQEMIPGFQYNDPADFWVFGQGTVFTLLLVNAIYLIISSRRMEGESQQKILNGTGLFLLIAAALDAGYLVDLYFRKMRNYDIFPKIVNIGGPGFIWIMVIMISAGFIPLIYPLEKYLMQNHALWRTKINVVSFIITIIPLILYPFVSNIDTRTLIAFIGIPLLAIALLLSIFNSFWFYLRLGSQSMGFMRKKAWLIAFGTIITWIAIFISFLSVGDGWSATVPGPVLLACGLYMMLRGHLMKIDT